MGIVKSLFRKGGDIPDAREPKPAAAPDALRLFMLTPDASGIAAYQISLYCTAREAETYLDEHLRGEVQEGAIVFWGLTWLPAPSDDGDIIEPVVLIRDIRRHGQVYTFSFADMGSAYDFIRHEMKAGLDLGQVSVYWALQARTTADFWGRATIIPPNPPGRARMHIVARREAMAEDPKAPAIEHSDGIEEPVVVTEQVPKARAEAMPEPLAELEQAELETVVRILDARGLAPSGNANGATAGAVKADEGEPIAEAAEIGDPDLQPIEGETVHVQLSDVYGGPMRIVRKTAPDSLNGLGDYGHEHEESAKFLPEGAPTVEEIAAPVSLIEAEEMESGVVAAWANICFAIDKALDVQVSKQVVAVIAWRRLATAFADACQARTQPRWRRLKRRGERC
ncbi:MAG TPA: hypothetical protein VMR52_03740 [Dehalococcoidia bacterium]|nr:hypothetical protein [Dehalococcoidia bacterium]